MSRRARLRPGEASLIGLIVLTAPVWVLVLRHAISQLAAIRAIAPDAALAAVAAAAWTRSPFAAVSFAVLLGSGLDLASDTPWGLTAARLGALAAIFASARQGIALDGIWGGLPIVGLFALLDRGLALLTLKAFVPAVELGVLLPRVGLIALYTALIGPIAFAVAYRLRSEP